MCLGSGCPGSGCPWTWSGTSGSSYSVSSLGHEGRRNAHALSSCFGLSGLTLPLLFLLKLAQSLNE